MKRTQVFKHLAWLSHSLRTHSSLKRLSSLECSNGTLLSLKTSWSIWFQTRNACSTQRSWNQVLARKKARCFTLLTTALLLLEKDNSKDGFVHPCSMSARLKKDRMRSKTLLILNSKLMLFAVVLLIFLTLKSFLLRCSPIALNTELKQFTLKMSISRDLLNSEKSSTHSNKLTSILKN